MLFKTKEGTYIEILRKQFTTDKAYFSKIMNVKGYCNDDAKVPNEMERIKSIVCNTCINK